MLREKVEINYKESILENEVRKLGKKVMSNIKEKQMEQA